MAFIRTMPSTSTKRACASSSCAPLRAQLSEAQAMALRTFEVLECDGLARVDLFLARRQLAGERDQYASGIHGDFDVPEALGVVGNIPTGAGVALLDLALDRAKRRSRLRRSSGWMSATTQRPRQIRPATPQGR